MPLDSEAQGSQQALNSNAHLPLFRACRRGSCFRTTGRFVIIPAARSQHTTSHLLGIDGGDGPTGGAVRQCIGHCKVVPSTGLRASARQPTLHAVVAVHPRILVDAVPGGSSRKKHGLSRRFPRQTDPPVRTGSRVVERTMNIYSNEGRRWEPGSPSCTVAVSLFAGGHWHGARMEALWWLLQAQLSHPGCSDCRQHSQQSPRACFPSKCKSQVSPLHLPADTTAQ